MWDMAKRIFYLQAYLLNRCTALFPRFLEDGSYYYLLIYNITSVVI